MKSESGFSLATASQPLQYRQQCLKTSKCLWYNLECPSRFPVNFSHLYSLQEPLSSLPEALKRQNKLWWIERVFMVNSGQYENTKYNIFRHKEMSKRCVTPKIL